MVALLLSSAATAYAQPVPLRFDPEQGTPFIKVFTPDDYNAGISNWGAVQDSSGVLYIANNTAVSIFNGAKWMHLQLGNRSPVRSLAVGPGGHIVVGGQDTFGYIARDSIGSVRYHALEDQLPEEYREFSDVWRVAVTPERAYFTGRRMVLWWDGEDVGVIPLPERLALMHQIGDEVYATDFRLGIMQVQGDTLVGVPGGEQFTGGPKLAFALMRYNDTYLLAGTNGGQLFLVGNGEATPFATTADAFLQERGIYWGIRLRDGNFAFALRSDGLVIIAPDGHLVLHLTKRHGLPDATVLALYEDQQGALWAMTRDGLAVIEYHQPSMTYGELQGIEGAVERLHRHNGQLYAGMVGEMRRLEWPEEGATQDPTFETFYEPEGGQNAGVQDIREVDGQLLVGEQVSAFVDARGRATRFYADERQQSMSPRRHVQSAYNPDLIYAVGEPYMYTLRREAGRWQFGRLFNDSLYQEIHTEVLDVAEVGPGSVLITVRNRGLYRFDGLDTDTPSLTNIPGIADAELQLSSAEFLTLNGTLYFHRARLDTDQPNLYRYEPEQSAFVPDSLLGPTFLDGRDGVFRAIPDAEQNLWMRLAGSNAVAWNTDEGYTLDRAALSRLPDGTVTDIVPEGDSLVWFSTRNGVYRYDRRRAKALETTPVTVPPAHIFSAFTLSDSTGYGGWYEGRLPLAPENNAVRFNFGWPYFTDLDNHVYQFRLVGSSDEWSAWTDEAQKDYTNLPPGDYAFQVRARDRIGQVSAPAVFAFSVAPHWYQTWWMRVLYALLAIGLIAAITRYISHLRLKRQVRQLEAERQVQVERERISSDLHDHVGAQLSNIISAVELVHLSAQHGDANKMMKYLDGLDEDARTTMARLRETIWALHKEETSIAAFAEQVRKFARERVRYSEGLSATVNLEASETAQGLMLRPTQALQLFRIAQEAISNAVKHAEAQNLNINLDYADDGHLTMTVRDDGAFKGPNTALNGGYGMQTMRDRAAEINAKLTVSGGQRGTEVAVRVPVEEGIVVA
ncbi:MAG: ATP-binding protein [Rhodothermales bacterium]